MPTTWLVTQWRHSMVTENVSPGRAPVGGRRRRSYRSAAPNPRNSVVTAIGGLGRFEVSRRVRPSCEMTSAFRPPLKRMIVGK
jgi:hypothetical protein